MLGLLPALCVRGLVLNMVLLDMSLALQPGLIQQSSPPANCLPSHILSIMVKPWHCRQAAIPG